MRLLKKKGVQKFYDNWGIKQDNPGPYEDLACDYLIKNGDFSNSSAVFEFGIGTAKFAKNILSTCLPEDSKYYAVDISETMVKISTERLQNYGDKVVIAKTNGEVSLSLGNESVDRFVSNFVFDILSDEEIKTLLDEAHRILKNDGLVLISSLARGCSVKSKLRTSLWKFTFFLNPAWMGGCRPLDLSTYVDREKFEIINQEHFDTTGVSSESIILKKI